MHRWNATSRRRAVLVALAALLLHAALWRLLGDTRQRAPAPARPAAMTLRLVPIAPVVARPSVALPARSVAPVPITRSARAQAPQRAPIAIGASPAEPAPAATAAIAPPAPAAGDTTAAPSLLDTDATRRAIRAAARAPSLGERLARARAEPDRIGPAERLANGVRDAGTGDCLKGEYADAGMGLLSIPFLALAAASGQCAK